VSVTDHVLDVGGATLSYDVQDGTEPTIVGLHGLTASRANDAAGGVFVWDDLVATGRRVVRYDARGHGRSTGSDDPADYAWSHLADDLVRLLDVVSPDAAVDAFGMSMGVGTLLHAVTREPDRFRRLALVIPPTAWETRAGQGDVYRQMADVVERDGVAALAAGADAMEPLPILADGDWDVVLPPDIRTELLPTIMRGAALTDLPAPKSIAAIRKPVLLRPWEGDPGHPVSTAERLHELIPGSVLEVMREPDDLRGLAARVAAFFS
jgi:3-oxoadipate enol-lactonase